MRLGSRAPGEQSEASLLSMSDENESENDDSSTDTDHDHDLADLREDVEENAESIAYLTDLLEKTTGSVNDLADVVDGLDGDESDESTDDGAPLEEPEHLPEFQ